MHCAATDQPNVSNLVLSSLTTINTKIKPFKTTTITFKPSKTTSTTLTATIKPSTATSDLEVYILLLPSCNYRRLNLQNNTKTKYGIFDRLESNRAHRIAFEFDINIEVNNYNLLKTKTNKTMKGKG